MNRFIQLCLPLFACSFVIFTGCPRPVASNPRVSASNVASLKKALGSDAVEAGPTAAVVVAEPQGWSILKGAFTLSDPAPARPALSITKDAAVCAPSGKQVLAEELVVDPNTKGIRDVVIYLITKYPAGDPKWEHPDYLANASGQNEIPFDQKACIFLSHVHVMRSTQTLLIKNSDDVGHNTSINPSPGSKAKAFNELLPNFGSTTYNPVGESNLPNPVSCSIHPWMSAFILTRNNPYYAVTKPDGTFVIENVPAGVELEFAVWQQKAGFLGTVKVAEDGAAPTDQTWKKGRFKRTLTVGKPLEMNVTVDLSAFNK